MMNRKEQLEAELAQIKANERLEREDKENQRLAELRKKRVIKMFGKEIGLVFNEAYDSPFGYNPDVVTNVLSNDGVSSKILIHDDSGNPIFMTTKPVVLSKEPEKTFQCIDKGRPGLVVFDKNGYAVFATAYYPSQNEMYVYNVKEVHAW